LKRGFADSRKLGYLLGICVHRTWHSFNSALLPNLRIKNGPCGITVGRDLFQPSKTVRQNGEDSLTSSMLRCLIGLMEDKSDAEAASPLLPLIEDHAATGAFIALRSLTVTGSLTRTIDRVGPICDRKLSYYIQYRVCRKNDGADSTSANGISPECTGKLPSPLGLLFQVAL
jgi:hypothetical protein